jgi:hypothetical protein
MSCFRLTAPAAYFYRELTNAIACRVRRKRQRLRSNGSIGSDPASGIISFLKLYRAGLLPIESYRQGGPIKSSQLSEAAFEPLETTRIK